jgi:hypothetical protein
MIEDWTERWPPDGDPLISIQPVDVEDAIRAALEANPNGNPILVELEIPLPVFEFHVNDECRRMPCHPDKQLLEALKDLFGRQYCVIEGCYRLSGPIGIWFGKPITILSDDEIDIHFVLQPIILNVGFDYRTRLDISWKDLEGFLVDDKQTKALSGVRNVSLDYFEAPAGVSRSDLVLEGFPYSGLGQRLNLSIAVTRAYFICGIRSDHRFRAVIQLLDDSFKDFVKVRSDLETEWTREAEGEKIIIEDLERKITDSRGRAISKGVTDSTIHVEVPVLERAFEVIDYRDCDGEKQVLRASPTKTFLDALTVPSKGSTVGPLAAEGEFVIVYARSGALGLFAFVEDGSLAEFSVGTQCEIRKVADAAFAKTLTAGPSIYWRPVTLPVNLTYDKAEAILRGNSHPGALARGPEIKRLCEGDTANRIILAGRSVGSYELSVTAWHRWWFRFKTPWLLRDFGIKRKAQDVADPAEVKWIVSVLTRAWSTFSADARAVHRAMTAAAEHPVLCLRDSKTCLVVELDVPDLEYTFQLPHGDDVRLTRPGSTTIKGMREWFERGAEGVTYAFLDETRQLSEDDTLDLTLRFTLHAHYRTSRGSQVFAPAQKTKELIDHFWPHANAKTCL